MNWQTFETLGLSFWQRTMRRSTWIGLPLLIGIAALAIADPIIPGPSTTVLTEPVREDWTIDYAAAINRTGQQRAQNGNALLMVDSVFHYSNDEVRKNIHN